MGSQSEIKKTHNSWMIVFAFYTALLANLVCALLKKRSNFLALGLYLCLFFVYAGNIRDGFADLTAYRTRYYAGASSIFFTDIGYSTLADFLSRNGVDFQVFLALIFLISTICIHIVCMEMKCNYNLLLSLYSLYYIFFCMEGLRFFISASITTLALYGIYKRKWIIGIVLFIVAFLFHKSAAFIVPFIFLYSKDEYGFLPNKRFKVLLIITGILILANIIMGNNASYLEPLFKIISDENIVNSASFYLSKSTRLGYLYYFLTTGASFAIIYCVKKNLFLCIETEKTKRLSAFVNFTYQLNLYSLIFLPFIMFNVTFMRYPLLISTVSFIALSFAYSNESFLDTLGSRTNVKMNTIYIWSSVAICFIIWWTLKINVISMFEAVSANMFNWYR